MHAYRIKYIIRILVILIFINSKSSSQISWSLINSPTTRTLTNCYFLNSCIGWISGDSGTIIHTTNSGTDWVIQNTGTNNNIEDIFFLNERLGWAVSYEVFPDSLHFPGTLILKTTDGGNNWSNIMFPDTNMFMKSVYFSDSLRGFLGGISASIVLTTNGGASWNYTDTDTSLFFILPVFKIKFFDNNLGYACGGFRDIAGITWVTTNGGLNWKGNISAPEPFFDLTILNSQKTICAGGDLEYGSSIVKTTDQGMNWNYDTLGVFGLASGIDNRNSNEIWLTTGYTGKFLFSADTGYRWNVYETPGNASVFDIDFTDSAHGFACGANGVIMKYLNTMSLITNSPPEIQRNDFSLYQNYPNPFNPVTIIKYDVKKSEHILITIYDVLGKETKVLVNEKKNAGSYEVMFDGNYFPGGIYFCKLVCNGFTETRRMVLLK